MRIITSELKEFVENNPRLVNRRESKRHPGLFVLKYDRRVFYDNLWHLSPLLMECRGLVVDADYNVIIKPFTKVFNYQENGTTIDRDELCTIVRKVNGFMGVATYAPHISDKLIYSTTGSLDSDFVDLIAKHVDQYEERIKNIGPGSYIFEICDETDPHIIKEEEGAWLIGVSDMEYEDAAYREDWLKMAADCIGCKRPEHRIDVRFSDIVKMAQECQHEGYMVYGNVSGTALKIKSPYYLTTKFLARAGDKKLMEGIFSNNINVARQKFDEEFYPLIDYLRSHGDSFLVVGEQDRIGIIRAFLSRNK